MELLLAASVEDFCVAAVATVDVDVVDGDVTGVLLFASAAGVLFMVSLRSFTASSCSVIWSSGGGTSEHQYPKTTSREVVQESNNNSDIRNKKDNYSTYSSNNNY